MRIPKLTEKDDIVSYLTMFERLMLAYEVKREKWVFKLAAHLVGKAQEAYAALSEKWFRGGEASQEDTFGYWLFQNHRSPGFCAEEQDPGR